MSEINYNSIPVAPFSISEFVENKTREFIVSYLNPHNYFVGDGYKIDSFLNELNQNEHRLQALCILINQATEVLDIHINGDGLKKFPCRQSSCQFEESIKNLLYIYYGKINQYGVNPYTDSFTREETFSNNLILNNIKSSLDKLLVGEEIIFDEVDRIAIEQAKQKVENAKGMQVLGKQNFATYIAGLSLELMSTAAIMTIYQSAIAPHIDIILSSVQKVIGN